MIVELKGNDLNFPLCPLSLFPRKPSPAFFVLIEKSAEKTIDALLISPA